MTEAAAPADEQAEPLSPAAGIPSQDEFDRDTLRQMLANARAQLAQGKAQVYLVKGGVEGVGHHEKLMKDVRAHVRAIEVLERLLADGMPTPSGAVIQIAERLPQDGPRPA